MAGELQLPDKTCEGEKDDKDSPDDQHTCQGLKDNPYGASTYVTLKLGPLSLGTQATFQDPMDYKADGIKNKRSIVAGAELTFGSNLSISYGEAHDKYR